MIAIMWHAQRAQWSAQCTLTHNRMANASAKCILNKITGVACVGNASPVRNSYMNIDADVFVRLFAFLHFFFLRIFLIWLLLLYSDMFVLSRSQSV